MDDLTERDIAPSGEADAVSELLPLLQSEEWQRRLEAARQQRERILAERGPVPAPPPKPEMPRLEIVSGPPLGGQSLARIEPLSGLRAGPVPRPEPGVTDEEEFEDFDEISALPPRPLPGLRIVPGLRPDAAPGAAPAAETAPPPPHLVPPVAAGLAAAAPGAAADDRKPWLSTRKIAGGFALGIAVGLGFSLSSLVAGWLTSGGAPGAVRPAAAPAAMVAPQPGAISAPTALAPTAVVPASVAPAAPTPTEAAAPVLADPGAGPLPATALALPDRAMDGAPLLPEAVAAPGVAAPPEPSLTLSSDPLPQVVALAGPIGAAGTSVGQIAPGPAADEAVLRPVPAPLSLSTPALPAVPAIAPALDTPPVSSARPEAILAATVLTLPPALPLPEMSARLPQASLVPARLTAPETSGSPIPDSRLSAPQAPPPLPLVEVQVFVPSATPESAVQATTGLIAAAGFAGGKTQAVEVTVKTTHVRYYHEADQALAERLAQAAGGTARSFIGSKNSPAEGVVELWLAGAPEAPAIARKAAPAKAAKPKKNQVAAARPAAPARPAQTDPIAAMKSSIAEKFDPKKFK